MKRMISLLLACLMLLSVMTACSGGKEQEKASAQETQTDASETASSSEPIVISMCGAITGDYSEYGLGYQAATKVQVDKWNAAGGIDGRQIVVKEYDEKGEIEEGVAIAQKVVADKDN